MSEAFRKGEHKRRKERTIPSSVLYGCGRPHSRRRVHCRARMACSRELVAVVIVSLWWVAAAAAAAQPSALAARPDPSDAHRMARWLVASNTWAVISTISIHLKGAPWGNVVAFSDGTFTNSTGVPYFYMTMLDPTPQDLATNSNCSITISEAPLGTCGQYDPEDPRCSKLTFYGEMEQLHKNEVGFSVGEQALFSKHPQMKDWPIDHNFHVYKFLIKDIFLIDYFGGPKKLSVMDYFKEV